MAIDVTSASDSGLDGAHSGAHCCYHHRL